MNGIKAEWQAKKLRDVCSIVSRGISPKYLNEGGVRVLNQRCIRNHEIDWSVARRHDVAAKHISPDRYLRAGDGLINSTGTGTLGRVAQILDTLEEPTTVDSHVTIVRPISGLFRPQFFGYMLIDIEDQLKDSGEGCGGQTELARSTIEDKFTVRFPSCVKEQGRIVAILDEAIEGIATAKANAERSLQNASALFDSRLASIFNQEGLNWERVTLSDLLERGWIQHHMDGNHGGDYPRKEEFISEGVPYIAANCLFNNQVDLTRAKYLSPERAARLRKGFAKDGDVLFAHNATVGPVAILRTSHPTVILGTSLTYYRCHPAYLKPEYLAHYMRSFGFRTQYESSMTQMTRNQVPMTKQREFFHVVPPLSAQESIAEELDQLSADAERLAHVYEQKKSALDALKQSLLHQAFTGKL